MVKLNVVGVTPYNRVGYTVLGAHRDFSLLEYTLTQGEVCSAVISVGDGKHRHLPAKTIIQMLKDPEFKVHGLDVLDGHRLCITSTYGKRLEELNHFDQNRIYSVMVEPLDTVLVGIHFRLHTEMVGDCKTGVSDIVGFRFYIGHMIVDFDLEKTAELLKDVPIKELSVTNGTVYVNDTSIINRLYHWNACGDDGTHYEELIDPQDIVCVRPSRYF